MQHRINPLKKVNTNKATNSFEITASQIVVQNNFLFLCRKIMDQTIASQNPSHILDILQTLIMP